MKTGKLIPNVCVIAVLMVAALGLTAPFAGADPIRRQGMRANQSDPNQQRVGKVVRGSTRQPARERLVSVCVEGAREAAQQLADSIVVQLGA